MILYSHIQKHLLSSISLYPGKKRFISDDILFTSQCEGVAGGRVVNTSNLGVVSLGFSYSS